QLIVASTALAVLHGYRFNAHDSVVGKRRQIQRAVEGKDVGAVRSGEVGRGGQPAIDMPEVDAVAQYDDVVSAASEEEVLTGAGVERIVAIAPDKNVVADAADQRVVAVTTLDVIVVSPA